MAKLNKHVTSRREKILKLKSYFGTNTVNFITLLSIEIIRNYKFDPNFRKCSTKRAVKSMPGLECGTCAVRVFSSARGNNSLCEF